MKTTNRRPLIFIPPPTGSVLGAQPHLLTSIVRGTPDEVCGAMPLLARGGLLLMQLLHGDISKSFHLAVCDPLAGTCSVLPPIKCKVERINCALLTDADFCSSSQGQGQRRTSCLDGSACFKVFTIVTDSIDIDNRKLSLYTFSSTEPRWSKPRRCFHKRGFTLLCQDAAVSHGVAHWFVSYHNEQNYVVKRYTYNVNAETGHQSLTDLSIPAGQYKKKGQCGTCARRLGAVITRRYPD
jgi:hypothetical protein